MQNPKPSTRPKRDPIATRRRLVEATIGLLLRQGFAGTTVDQICAEAEVTKGSFFHHFESKEAIGKTAVEAWGEFGTALYAEAWRDASRDPLEQLHDFFDIMTGFTERPDQVCTCVVGMLSQELAQINEGIRDECARQLNLWTENAAKLLAAAKAKHCPDADFDPQEVAWFLNSLWQGSMLVGKTRQRPEIIRQNLQFARAWLNDLLGNPQLS